MNFIYNIQFSMCAGRLCDLWSRFYTCDFLVCVPYSGGPTKRALEGFQGRKLIIEHLDNRHEMTGIGNVFSEITGYKLVIKLCLEIIPKTSRVPLRIVKMYTPAAQSALHTCVYTRLFHAHNPHKPTKIVTFVHK